MEFSSDSEGGPKMGPAGEQTEEEKEAIEAYMAYIENERGMMPSNFCLRKNLKHFSDKIKFFGHFKI